MSNGVRFIRVHGRVVPIRDKNEGHQKAVGVSVASAGAVVAADAARTTRIYQKGGVAIDKKLFAFQPMANTLGTSLHLSKKGEHAAKVFFYKTGDNAGKEFSISWLSTAKKFRGQGLSKDLMKHASVQMRAQGGTSLFSHVVHPNSAGLGKARGTFWKELSNGYLAKVSEPTAMKHVKAWAAELKSKPSPFGIEGIGARLRSFAFHKGKDLKESSKASAIFREVRIPNFRSITHTAFRTTANKIALGLGVAAVAGGLYYAFRKRNDGAHR